MELSEKQKEIVNANEPKIVVIAAAASGKAQPDYTKIPTPQGFRRLDELEIGDKVFDKNGQPTTVLGIFPQGSQEIYEVELADGRIVECCAEHLWSYNNGHNGLTTHTTQELINLKFKRTDNRGHTCYPFKIPNCKEAIVYNTNKKLPIDPYTMGCFLGDGCCTETGLTISSADEELVSTIALANKWQYKKNSDHNYNWTFYRDGQRLHTKEIFKDYESNLICYCGQKSIPEDYLTAGIEERYELLRGLMDTDGHIGNGRHSPAYSTTSIKLAEGVANLARSLGFYSKIYTLNRLDKKSIEYTVNIFTGSDLVYTIFKLSRKRNRALEFTNHTNRLNHKYVSIVDIRATGKFTEMRCIYVDNPDHLYITNDYVITHNTTVLVERLRRLIDKGINAESIVAITFTNAAAENIQQRLGEKSKNMFVGTVHSYANYLLRSYGVDTSDYLEKENFDALFELVQKYPHCIKPVEYLLVDESQDSTADQFAFFELIAPTNYFYVGDYRQSIFRWAQANPDYILNLMQSPDVTVYDLNENYRCGSAILEYAQNIIRLCGIDYQDHSRAMRGVHGKVVDVSFSSDALVKGIQKYDEPGDWFVICRTNGQVEIMCDALKRAGIPYDTFKKKDLTLKELNERMAANNVKVLTIHAAKGLEAKNVAVVGVRFYNIEEKCIAYVAATRARDLLVWTREPKKTVHSTRFVKNWE